MEYMSVKQAAEKWNMSERFVQRRCLEGRIFGATKFGTAWMIPQSADKPDDMRTTNKNTSGGAASNSSATTSSLTHKIMPLISAAFPLGKCKEYIDGIKDKDEKNIATAEYFYYTGNEKKCSDIAELYIDSDIFEFRTSALWLYAFSNLSMGRISHVRKALKTIRVIYDNTDENSPKLERAIAVCLYNSAYTQFRTIKPKNLPQAQQYVHLLPSGLRLFILFNQALYAFSNNLYGTTVGIAETGLVMDDIRYPISDIYLHLACAMGYMHINYPKLSRLHFQEAWGLAKADGFVQPFAETHGLLCGMLESSLKKAEPEEYRKIIKIVKNYSSGWIKIHNEVSGDQIPLDLTPNEYVISMLVARGWRSKEIGALLDITDNAVHKTVSEAMGKIGVTKRSDIKKIMLPNMQG